MAKFEDTPKWKKRATWDPVAQTMRPPVRKPTPRQLAYLQALCEQRGIEYRRPQTRRDATSAIDRLLVGRLPRRG